MTDHDKCIEDNLHTSDGIYISYSYIYPILKFDNSGGEYSSGELTISYCPVCGDKL